MRSAMRSAGGNSKGGIMPSQKFRFNGRKGGRPQEGEMMNIVILGRVFSGNLLSGAEGDFDYLASARRYAEMACEQFRKRLVERYPDAEIEIGYPVQDVEGYCPTTEVSVDATVNEELTQLIRDIEEQIHGEFDWVVEKGAPPEADT